MTTTFWQQVIEWTISWEEKFPTFWQPNILYKKMLNKFKYYIFLWFINLSYMLFFMASLMQCFFYWVVESCKGKDKIEKNWAKEGLYSLLGSLFWVVTLNLIEIKKLLFYE